MLVPGQSLAGIHLGDTAAAVRKRWGARFRVCSGCPSTTWYYGYGDRVREPVGAGVTFSHGRVSAVYTLGSPDGWRTREGLRMGESLDRVTALYGRMRWRLCIGYGALTIRGRRAVTSIYTTGESVYGFALSRPTAPVCH